MPTLDRSHRLKRARRRAEKPSAIFIGGPYDGLPIYNTRDAEKHNYVRTGGVDNQGLTIFTYKK